MILSMRGTYTATIDEVNIPREVTGAAVSFASLIGYLPTMFSNYIFGTILDKVPGERGYDIVFGLMLASALMGVVITSLLLRRIKSNHKNGRTIKV
jgi:sugar phosphate permease